MDTLRICTMVILCAIINPINGTRNATAQDDLDPELSKRISNSATQILFKAERIEVYSLDPSKGKARPKEGAKKEEGLFHGWSILKSVAVTDKDQLKELANSTKSAITEGKSTARCFIPRHGLRASIGERWVEMVICYECWRVEIYSAEGLENVSPTTRNPQDMMNRILSKKPETPK